MVERGFKRPTLPRKRTRPVAARDIPPKPLTSFWKMISALVTGLVLVLFLTLNKGFSEKETGPRKFIPPKVVVMFPEINEEPDPV